MSGPIMRRIVMSGCDIYQAPCWFFYSLNNKIRGVVLGGHPKILADRLTLSQSEGGGADYAHQTGAIRFSDLRTALQMIVQRTYLV